MTAHPSPHRRPPGHRLFRALPLALPLTLLLLAPPASAQASAPLGRLFFTPGERAALDRQRAENPLFLPAPAGPLTLNGEIRRTGQAPLRWINGQLAPGIDTGPLPVGHRLDPGTGAQDSPLGEGRLRIHPPRQ